MGESVHQLPTADFVDVVAAADGVVLRMSENAAETFRFVLERVVALLERGEAPESGRRLFGLRPARSAEQVLRQMFPDAYADSALAAGFRREHGEAQRAEALAAVRRVLDGWAGAVSTYLERAEVDDWLRALGVARFAFAVRKGDRLVLGGAAGKRSDLTAQWLAYLLESFVHTLCPSVVAATE
ncbi:DUF2017 family protein [Solihabitans fulvus]|uniref:DUF2017 family protein n=1 Tax=Solihabitans fulvus TaxID=1892852 RepID=A0A5B2XHB7_9PSEU|nr:DUF2017 family protein [Solihabitans fulvus]KAA2262596.1 DUF2017 family protein [Solihabitans fulvus]